MNPLRYVTAVMGFCAAALAIARDDRTLTWIAIGFLGSSFGVRMIQRYQRRREEADDNEAPPGD